MTRIKCGRIRIAFWVRLSNRHNLDGQGKGEQASMRMMKLGGLQRGAWSWALYDWANSAFILSVITVFYGGFFESFWYNGAAGRGLFWQGVSVTASSILVALLAPCLGSLANSGPVKKRWLFRFAMLGSFSTAALALVPAGGWGWAILLRLTASAGFFGSLVFYDALLPDVSNRRNRHLVSGLGFSVGYFGSVLLLAVQFFVFASPETIGLQDEVAAIRAAFFSVAVWWLLFTWPLMRFVEESDSRPVPRLTDSLRMVWPEMKKNFRLLRGHRPALLFLIAYFFYIDGVNTLIQMVSGFAGTIGIDQGELIGAIVLVQVVGVPFAIFLGWLGQVFRPKPLIFVCIAVYFAVTAYAFRFSGEPVVIGNFAVPELYVLGFLIGMVQGGLQSLSRSYFANLIPAAEAAGFFGFYNMLGKGGAILGPILMGAVGLMAGDPRWGVLSVSILFVVGALLLLRTPAEESAAVRPLRS